VVVEITYIHRRVFVNTVNNDVFRGINVCLSEIYRPTPPADISEGVCKKDNIINIYN